MTGASRLLEVADELYGLGLGDFTAARDARAKDLRSEDRDLAAAVKALRKPATAAWVVNQLVRGDAEQVAQVLAVGEALREAQRSMSGEELRALTRQRRQVTAAVTTRARGVARERGLRVTEAVAEQVEATLTAAMVDAGCAEAVRSGLLVAALASTGVEPSEVGDAVAVPEALGFTPTARPAGSADDGTDGGTTGGTDRGGRRADLHVVPDPDAAEKARDAADAALAEAEQAREDAQEEHDAARSEVEQLEARALQVGSEIEELRRRLAEAESTAEEVDDELGDAEGVLEEAAATLAEATSARDSARRAREALDQPT